MISSRNYLLRCFSSSQVKFGSIAGAFRQIESISSRNEKKAIFNRMLAEISSLQAGPSDDSGIKDYVRVSIGLFAPRFDEEFEVNIAEQLTISSLAQCYNKDPTEVKAMVRETGDFGDVAVILRAQSKSTTLSGLSKTIIGSSLNLKPVPLSLKAIVEGMNTINKMTGEDSVNAKITFMVGLFNQCQTEDELRYLVRSFSNTGLRIGLSTKSVEQCIIDHFKDHPEMDIKLADLEKTIFGYRIQKLHERNTSPIYNVPIKSMVGRAAKDSKEVLSTLNKKFDRRNLSAEFKYDGERTQIHYNQGQLNMFSRNTELQNSKFWHLRSLLINEFEANKSSFIIDGEIVYTDQDGQLLPFQQIERKLQTEELTQNIQESDKQPKLFVFDVLARNEQSLCNQELTDRRLILQELFPEESNLIALSKKFDLPTYFETEEELVAALDKYQQESISSGCEGIIIKSNNSLYETAGIRTNSWVKLKHMNLGSGLRDTLDLVPIGAYFGKGNRTGMYGSFLMAAYNFETCRFESICRLGTGFSWDLLKKVQSKLSVMEPDDNELAFRKAKQMYHVHSMNRPDVWFEPQTVWEVQADCFTLSGTHHAGRTEISARTGTNSGLSLRFPRFKRERPDKRINIRLQDLIDRRGDSASTECGTSVQDILEMYRSATNQT